MLFDTHMHTLFSTDSRMRIEDALAKGVELNIGITITEHLDLDYPKPASFIFDLDDFFRDYLRYRSDKVLLGIEIGIQTGYVEKYWDMLDGYSFDFVLGSVHVVGGLDIYMADYYTGRTKREAYGEYFESMIDCLRSYDYIDSLGHIDYISRYARFDDPEIWYSEFDDYIDNVLSLLVEKQKAIEINTRRLGQPEVAKALIPIYRRFAELGGKLVTLGSDAHNPADIGKHFAAALEIAEKSGLKPVWFECREPRYIQF